MISQKYNVNIQPFSYVIYKDGPTIKAVNGTTDIVDYNGTDAATVINNAISSLKNGGKILIKEGMYNISNSIILKGGITIEGMGFATTLMLADNANVDVIYLAPNANNRTLYITLKDFRINGNKTNNLTAGNGIHVNSIFKCLFENIRVINCRERGIFLTSSAGNKDNLENLLINCYVSSCEKHGVQLSWTQDTVLFQIYSEYNTQNGIALYSSSNTLIRTHCYNNALNGLLLDQGDDNYITNCRFEYNQMHGLYIKTNRNKVIGCRSLSNSKLNAGVYNGIHINNGQHNMVTSSVMTDGQNPKQKYGIEEAGTSDYNILSNNVFIGNSVGAINSVGTNTIIKHNQGYKTENNILSEAFSIDSIGIVIVVIAHDLAITPVVQDCYLTVVQNTAVDDWAYNMLKIVSTDSKNVIAKINISIASKTIGATAKLALRVGNS